jgi:hypothetical protein
MACRDVTWAPAGAGGPAVRNRKVPPVARRRRDGSAACAGRSPRRRRPGEHGHALITTMIAAACLVPLGAFAAMQARLDALVQHYTRAAVETFAVAESGLEHALADFTADPRFERLLAGPDRQAGTGDDGEYPFRQAPPEFFPHAPFRYQVRVAARPPDAIEIHARGSGPMNATRVVVATVRRSAVPFVPGALALAARDGELSLGTGFAISGVEAGPDDPGLPAVAVDGADAAAALAARLPSDAAARLVGRGGSPSIAGTSLPSAAALAAAAANRAGAQVLNGEAHGALGDGLFVSPTALRLSDVSGSGVLVALGALDLGGTTTFSGLIIALGDVRADLGSNATIAGAVMVGAAGAVVSLRGNGGIGYDARVIAGIDAAFPGLLPRQARVTGWREEPEAGL